MLLLPILAFSRDTAGDVGGKVFIGSHIHDGEARALDKRSGLRV